MGGGHGLLWCARAFRQGALLYWRGAEGLLHHNTCALFFFGTTGSEPEEYCNDNRSVCKGINAQRYVNTIEWILSAWQGRRVHEGA